MIEMLNSTVYIGSNFASIQLFQQIARLLRKSGSSFKPWPSAAKLDFRDSGHLGRDQEVLVSAGCVAFLPSERAPFQK